MNISQNQFRNLYGLFIVMFTISVGYTMLNFHESRRLRILQQEIAEEQLKQIKNRKKGAEENI